MRFSSVGRTRRGQSSTEFAVLVAVIASALWLPVGDGGSLVTEIEAALTHFWVNWRTLTLGS